MVSCVATATEGDVIRIQRHGFDSKVSSGAGAGNGVSTAAGVEGDDSEPPVDLTFDDPDLVPATLSALNMMRKNRHFCDVILQAPGGVEVAAHRAVLAAASPYLFELFTTDQDRGPATLPLSYKLDGSCDKTSLRALVEYAYTGKLRVAATALRGVQQCAWQLRMDAVARGCGDALAAKPTIDTCLAVRSLPGLSMQQRVHLNTFIADNFTVLYTCSALSALPAIKLEILDNCLATDHRKLPAMAVTWLQDTLTNDDITINDLCSRPHLLYVHESGIIDSVDGLPHSASLRDAARLPPANEDTPVLQDYKRMAAIQSKNAKRQLSASQSSGQIVGQAVPQNGTANGANGTATNGARPRGTFYSHHIAERLQTDFDWTVIASDKVNENVWLSVVSLGEFGCAAVSVVVSSAPANSTSSSVAQGALAVSPVQLAPLDRPRSAHGAAALNGKLIICGGYDRVECLKSCEKYNPITNTWSPMADMRQPRGRFSIAQIGNRLFAVGGSDGHNELDSVEMYEEQSSATAYENGSSSSVSRSMTASVESQSDLSTSDDNCESVPHQNGNINGNKANSGKGRCWKSRARLPLARSHVAVCGYDSSMGRVFCVGGWTGQRGVRECHVYSVAEDKWTTMPPLSTGRYQAAAVVWQGALWSLGGCDAWHCLTSTEVIPLDQIDETDGKWTNGPDLSMARRGCTASVFRGRLIALGGSDGTSSLRSVEALSSPEGSWSLAPPLREKRAAPSATVIQDRLYVVGGFSGKHFLSSMEYLSDLDGEWTTIVTPLPAQMSTKAMIVHGKTANGGLTDAQHQQVTVDTIAAVNSDPEENTDSNASAEELGDVFIEDYLLDPSSKRLPTVS